MQRPYLFEKFRNWTPRRVLGYSLAFAGILAVIILIILRA